MEILGNRKSVVLINNKYKTFRFEVLTKVKFLSQIPETRPPVLRAAISLHLYRPLFPGRPLDQEQFMLFPCTTQFSPAAVL